MAEFKIGDIVQLKSGGPEMTITGRDRNAMSGESKTHWSTTWFKGHEQQYGTFHEDTLEKVEYGTAGGFGI